MSSDDNLDLNEISNDEVHSEVHSEVNSEVKSEVNSEVNSEVHSEVKSEVNSQVNSQVHSEVISEVNNQVSEQVESSIEIDPSVVKKRKKHVQFMDDEMIVVKKRHHKKAKLSDKNLNPKELLESVLFESDESSDNEEPDVIQNELHTKTQEKKQNDLHKEDVDHYTKNILEKIDFSESDDLDDFIERDEGNKTDRFSKSNDISTGAMPFMNRSQQTLTDPNLDSYRLALDVFGDDFDANDFNFEKPFVNDDEENLVSDDSTKLLEEYSDDLTTRRIPNRKNIVQKSIYELFEPEELKRQYLTNTDEAIRTRDIPERFQVRSNPVQSAFNEELEEEANWIYDNFFNKKINLLTNEKRLMTTNSVYNNHPSEHTKYIKAALNLIRNELCEIPFILTYRHENINGVFNEDELWMIYRADNKWMSFSKQMNEFSNYLNHVKDFQNSSSKLNHDFYYKISDRDMKYLKNIKSDEEFFDFYKKIQLYNGIYKSELMEFSSTVSSDKTIVIESSNGGDEDHSQTMKNEDLHKDPNMFNRHHFYITKGIDKVVNCFGLKASDFDENIRVQYRKYTLEPCKESPNSLAEKYISPFYDTCEKVLEAAVEMYVVEIANEQHVRRYVRQIFLKNARLDVHPTKSGIDEIDETHPYCSFKYISNKPLKTITSEMFIKLNQAKIEKLLQVEISITDSVKKEILEYLKNFQTPSSSDNSSFHDDNNHKEVKYTKEWSDLCGKAIEKAIFNYCIPSITRDLYQKLLNEAHDDLIVRCAKIFKNHLIASPFSRELEKSHLENQDEYNEVELPYILVINVPQINYNKSFSKTHRHQMKSVGGNINHHSLASQMFDSNNNNNEDGDFDADFTVGTSVDEIGYVVVMNADSELIEQATLNNCILKNFNHERDSGSLRFSELSLKKIDKMVSKYNISDVFVPLMNRDYSNLAQNLEKRFSESKLTIVPQVHLINPYISNKVVKMMSAGDTLSQLKIEFEKTLSLGRYIIDPLVECVNLFSTECDLSDLFAPYQILLNREKLRSAFEEKIVSMVNEVGVDVNKTCSFPKYSLLFQYVCGMGPRKAIKMMNDMRAQSDSAKLNNRTQLVTVCNLGPKVFINCAGFLKIVGSVDEEGDIDLLDATRIHPELYDWARKIMVDALEIEDNTANLDSARKYDYNDLLETLRSDSSKLKDLDLDAFADELMKNGVPINKKYSLELISTEMLKEFPDYRPRFIPLNWAEKFWILANGGSRIDLSETLEYATLASKNSSDLSRFHNEDLIPLYVGKLVSFVITNFIYKRPDRENITKAVPGKDDETQLWKCPYCLELISHDLKKCWSHIEDNCPGRAVGIMGFLEGFFASIHGFVTLSNISDNPPDNIKERVKQGMHLTCQVQNIRFDRFSVDLTCRSSDLIDQENHCYKFKRDTHFDLNAEEEQRQSLKDKAEKIKNQVVYLKKVIIHPAFKNISFSDAENLLKTADIGECIIRPSSKGTDHLTVTWKVHDNIYQHIDVVEQDKPNQFSLGKKLWIKNECYEDLDEIIARYISPMVTLVTEVVKLKVFNFADGGSRHKIAAILSEEKKVNPLRIPYIFAPCKIYPGKFLLGFLPRNTPIFEYISVTPDGVKFRDVVHNSFEEMIVWFKKNFGQSNNLPHHSQTMQNKNLSNNPANYISSPISHFNKHGPNAESVFSRRTPNQDFSNSGFNKKSTT